MQLGGAAAEKPKALAAGATPPATRPTPTQRRSQRTRGARGIQIGDQNPAIPLDRVPYFGADLLRLAITAVVMIALLIIGAKLVIPHFTG
ncbi:MAG: hypothetical protein ACREQM_04985 [Candidatus Dormibacteraceae bacterium]